MFGDDLDWLLNASRGFSSIAEFLVWWLQSFFRALYTVRGGFRSSSNEIQNDLRYSELIANEMKQKYAKDSEN